eukprot:5918911-Pleurochrysis_carterae.AAC.2
MAHSCPPLSPDGCIQSADAHVSPRASSSSLSSGLPTSPARRSRLCARRTAAHSMRLRAVPPQPPSSASRGRWWAHMPRLSLRVPTGGSSCRMRRSAIVSGPPGCSGATSCPASRDRSSLIADT